MANKKISDLPDAGTITGTELVEVVQGGVNKKTPASTLGDGGGGGSVADASETVKGIVEEATDAETAAGDATGGTGAKLFVTPSKLLTRLTSATQAEMITGTNDTKPATAKSVEDKRSVKSIPISNGATGSTNIDCLSKQELKVVYNTTVTGAITITKSNDSNLEIISIFIPITGSAIAITFPSDVRMARSNEVASGDGWNQSDKILTVTSVGTADLHEFSLNRVGSIFILVYSGPTRA
jgi:hypothetical protein